MLDKTYGSLREKIAAETKERKARYGQFEAAYAKAKAAGLAAGQGATPTAMMVVEPSDQMASMAGKWSPPKQMWHEPEGACGFAWVTVHPGTSSFARWLKKSGHGRSNYGGGMCIWISEHGQSIERKEAHARAMAEVLCADLGVKAYAGSRLD